MYLDSSDRILGRMTLVLDCFILFRNEAEEQNYKFDR